MSAGKGKEAAPPTSQAPPSSRFGGGGAMNGLSSPHAPPETDECPSIVNVETKDLYQTLQRARQLLGDDASDPSLLDLIMVGEEGVGKSSIMASLSGVKLPTFTPNQVSGLVRDRPFVAVLTFSELLREEHFLVRQVQMAKQELERKGCKGFFLISLEAGGNDHSPAWYRSLLDDCAACGHLTRKELTELRNMSGMPKLRQALEKLQYQHLLTSYSDVMGKLRLKLQEAQPIAQRLQQPEVQLQNEFCQALLLVQRDVEESHRGKDQLGDFCEVDHSKGLNSQISQILNAFAAKAFNTALANINRRWASEAPNVNNTLMIDWRTKIWNISSKGMHEVLGETVAEQACTDLKKILLDFLQWRAHLRLDFMSGSVLSSTIFMDFLERYTSEKLSVLQRECQLIREEVHMNELDTQAPFAYWLFVQQAMQGKEENAEAMVVNILQHALGVQNATLGQRQGAFWPMDLEWYHDLFSKELQQHQLLSIVLQFFTVGEIVERLSKRMVCVMFGRTYFPRGQGTAAAGTSKNLADLTLEQAFRRYAADNNINMRELVDQSLGFQSDLQLNIENAMTALQRFGAAAWNAASLTPPSASSQSDAATFQRTLSRMQSARMEAPIMVMPSPRSRPPSSTGAPSPQPQQDRWFQTRYSAERYPGNNMDRHNAEHISSQPRSRQRERTPNAPLARQSTTSPPTRITPGSYPGSAAKKKDKDRASPRKGGMLSNARDAIMDRVKQGLEGKPSLDKDSSKIMTTV
ncbi:hypothetical protein WJX73_001781 [Symbiochloris irregularis]|uniref:Uncharacterized protein n=1 Tax=Symbiochloris irregularis TaxID=706552 RepID=A0AAW1Q2D5_9CHLO